MTQSIPQTLPDSREAFEAFMMTREAPSSAKRKLGQRDGDEYAHQHVARHWYTWQQAVKFAALSAQPLVGVIPEGMALVPIDLLTRAVESLGSFVSDHGWAQSDMDTMDELSAKLSVQPLAGQQDMGEATGNAETYLRGRYGAYRGHFAWRELEEAFNAGAAIGTPPQGVDHG